MPKVNSSSPTLVTRQIVKVLFATLKKIGNTRGVTLKKIHDYIRYEYPNSPTNIVRLNNTLQKALAFGVVTKKGDRFALGRVVKRLVNPGRKRLQTVIVARRHRRRGRGRRGRRRRRRSRRGRGRR